MNTYALRCIEADIEQLVTLATALGVIKVVDGQVTPELGCAWDYIGYKRVGQEIDAELPDNRPFAEDENGNRYVHINAITSFNVRERAEALALENPAIAAGLAAIPRFFIVDAEGNATWPEYPMRVFC